MNLNKKEPKGIWVELTICIEKHLVIKCFIQRGSLSKMDRLEEVMYFMKNILNKN